MDEMLEEQPDTNSQNPYTTSIAMDRYIDSLYVIYKYCNGLFQRFLQIKKNKLYDPFLWIGFNYLKVTVPLQGDSLPFTTKSPGVPGTHLIDLGRIKG